MSLRSQPPNFFLRHRIKIFVGALLVGGLGFALSKHSSSGAKREVSNVVLLAPPPPPPPPPKTPPPPPKKMIEQTPVAKDEPKPTPQAPKSPPIGPATLGKGAGIAVGGGNGGDGGGGGSRWGWYASGVQNTIRQALQENPSTHHAAMGITVRIWPDFTGRITRAELVTSTGNASLDDAIQNQVLTGLSLPGGPPPGMPMPINLRISARP